MIAGLRLNNTEEMRSGMVIDRHADTWHAAGYQFGQPQQVAAVRRARREISRCGPMAATG